MDPVQKNGLFSWKMLGLGLKAHLRDMLESLSSLEEGLRGTWRVRCQPSSGSRWAAEVAGCNHCGQVSGSVISSRTLGHVLGVALQQLRHEELCLAVCRQIS